MDDEQDLSDLDVDIGGIERAITEEKDEENEQSKDNGNDHSMEAISPITEIPCRTPPSDSRERGIHSLYSLCIHSVAFHITSNFHIAHWSDSDKSSGRSAEQEIALNLDDFANRSYTFPKSGEFEPMNANDQTNDARSDAQWSDFNSMNSDDRSNGNENRSVHVPAPISLDSPPKDRGMIFVKNGVARSDLIFCYFPIEILQKSISSIFCMKIRVKLTARSFSIDF